MKILWETSFWHRVTPHLKHPDYAPEAVYLYNNQSNF